MLENFFKEINEKDNFVVVALNNVSNINFISRNWKKLSNYKSLSIMFVNPFSNSDKVWNLNPYVHNNICDTTSLEVGFKAMANMVESIDEYNMKRKIKLKEEESDQ